MLIQSSTVSVTTSFASNAAQASTAIPVNPNPQGKNEADLRLPAPKTIPSSQQNEAAGDERRLNVNQQVNANQGRQGSAGDDADSSREEESQGENGKKSAANPKGLTEAELRQVRELKIRDQQVRAHEQAHLGAAGGLARGGASFSYQVGPDGQRYAVGGEVSIDSSPVPGNPEATLQKAQRIQRAALAPIDPSGQDRQVATAATSLVRQAQAEIADARSEETAQRLSEGQASSEDNAAQESSQSAESEEARKAEQNKEPFEYVSLLGSGENADESDKASGVRFDASAGTLNLPDELFAGRCELCGGAHSAAAHSQVVEKFIKSKISEVETAGQDRTVGLSFNQKA